MGSRSTPTPVDFEPMETNQLATETNPPATPALLLGQAMALVALAVPDHSAQHQPGGLRRTTGALLMFAGVGLASAGALALGPALRATPAPPPSPALRTTGPYALSRHPIYAGLVLTAVGRTIRSGGRRHLVATAGLCGIFRIKAHYEEALLSKVTPYESYQNSVPRWGLRTLRRKSWPEN